MDDLISRQDAIDKVVKESQVDGAYGYMDTKSLIDLLEDLPSVQPEWQVTGKLNLIDRQAAIDALKPWLNVEGYSEGEVNMLRAVLYELKTLPAAQPERKKGLWIYYPKASGSVTSTAVYFLPVCSECGCEHPIANYCPNCGADMREPS